MAGRRETAQDLPIIAFVKQGAGAEDLPGQEGRPWSGIII